MNIFKNELKRNSKVTYIWIVSVMIASIMFMAMSPLFLDQSEALKGYLEAMGPELMQGMGINIDTFFTPVGFFGYIGGYITLALSVQGMIYGLKTFLIEKNQKTTEFLYTKPVSRTNVFTQKVLANVCLLAFTQIIIIATIMSTTSFVSTVDYDSDILFKMAFSIVPIQFLFYGLGLLIGSSVDKLKNIVSVALGVSIGMYFLNVMSALFDSKVLNYISFFSYFNLSKISVSGSYDGGYIVLTIILLVALFGGSYAMFNKRDFKAV